MATPKLIPASLRYTADHGWLRSHHLFSFAEYRDPANIRFGSLRVFNHDIIAGNTGFDPHPHQEMEIVTLVLRGAVMHVDSTGGKGLTKAGDVQIMHAGSGVEHSEHNREAEELELFQLWFLPSQSKVMPGYAQRSFSPSDYDGKVALLVGPMGSAAPLHIHSPAFVHRVKLAAGQELTMPDQRGLGLFVYLFAGNAVVEGPLACSGDGAGRDWRMDAGDQFRWPDAPVGVRMSAGDSGAEAIVILA